VAILPLWPNSSLPGETVLDLASGGGIDVLLSAKRVGPSGKAEPGFSGSIARTQAWRAFRHPKDYWELGGGARRTLKGCDAAHD
jgi:hypothetical protein